MESLTLVSAQRNAAYPTHTRPSCTKEKTRQRPEGGGEEREARTSRGNHTEKKTRKNTQNTSGSEEGRRHTGKQDGATQGEKRGGPKGAGEGEGGQAGNKEEHTQQDRRGAQAPGQARNPSTRRAPDLGSTYNIQDMRIEPREPPAEAEEPNGFSAPAKQALEKQCQSVPKTIYKRA